MGCSFYLSVSSTLKKTKNLAKRHKFQENDNSGFINYECLVSCEQPEMSLCGHREEL